VVAALAGGAAFLAWVRSKRQGGTGGEGVKERKSLPSPPPPPPGKPPSHAFMSFDELYGVGKDAVKFKNNPLRVHRTRS
jgi:hypothetical protein